ncbi:hypothetical protein AB4Z02_07455, partial [Pedococcus sp. 2YAF34]
MQNLAACDGAAPVAGAPPVSWWPAEGLLFTARWAVDGWSVVTRLGAGRCLGEPVAVEGEGEGAGETEAETDGVWRAAPGPGAVLVPAGAPGAPGVPGAPGATPA